MRLLKMFVSQAFFWGFILCYCFGFEGLRFFGFKVSLESKTPEMQGKGVTAGLLKVL